jgi:hypothetical protein
MKFAEADVLIDIEGLRYETPSATLRLGAAAVRPDGIDLPVAIRLRETKATVDRIVIRFRTNSKKRSFLDKFYVELKGTSLSSANLDSLSLDLVVNARTTPDGVTTLTLPTHSFTAFEAISAERLQQELVLDPGAVSTPNFSLNIGRTELDMRVEAFKSILETRKSELANLVFDPLVAEIKKVPAELLKSEKTSLAIPADLQFDLPCLGKTGVKIMQYGRIGANQLMIGLGLVHPEYRMGRATNNHFAESTDLLYDKIGNHHVTAAIAVRGRLIAWGIEKAARGCMKDKLPPGLATGPAGVHSHMRAGDGPDGIFAVHAQSNLKGLAKLLLGKPLVEFPVKVAPKLDFRSGGLEPAKFVLDLSEADLSPETLRGGYDGIPSNIPDLRMLRKMVVKKVQKQLHEGLAKAKIEIPLKFLESPDVSYADIESDQHGHLDLLLSLDSEIQPGAHGFWESMAPYLKKVFVPKDQRAELSEPRDGDLAANAGDASGRDDE